MWWRRSIHICFLDDSQRFFTWLAIGFKQIEALLNKLITLPCSDAHSPACSLCGIEEYPSCLHLTLWLATDSVLLPPSLNQDHLCLFYVDIAV